MAAPANPDWTRGRSSLPILYAQLVDHPDQARFQELHQDICQPGALKEAQEILIRSGAISYCIHHLLQRHQAAKGLLATIPLQQTKGLHGLLEAVIEPVKRLFAGVGEADKVTGCVQS